MTDLTEPAEQIDGFYTGYFSGKQGYGLAMFIFRDGIVSGTDAAGTSFDGRYEVGGDSIRAQVHVKAPPGISLMQGPETGEHGLEYDVRLDIPLNAREADVVRLDTPLGPVNARFVRLRGLH